MHVYVWRSSPVLNLKPLWGLRSSSMCNSYFSKATIMIRSGLDWLLGLLRWITVWSIQYACYRVWSCLWMCMHVMVIYVMYVNGCACAMILITSRWSTGQWYISSHLCYRVLFILKSNGCSSDKTSPCACLIVDMAGLCRTTWPTMATIPSAQTSDGQYRLPPCDAMVDDRLLMEERQCMKDEQQTVYEDQQRIRNDHHQYHQDMIWLFVSIRGMTVAVARPRKRSGETVMATHRIDVWCHTDNREIKRTR